MSLFFACAARCDSGLVRKERFSSEKAFVNFQNAPVSSAAVENHPQYSQVVARIDQHAATIDSLRRVELPTAKSRSTAHEVNVFAGKEGRTLAKPHPLTKNTGIPSKSKHRIDLYQEGVLSKLQNEYLAAFEQANESSRQDALRRFQLLLDDDEYL